MTITSMSEIEAKEELRKVHALELILVTSKSKNYTYWSRVNKQKAANLLMEKENYYERREYINSVFANPVNIERWSKISNEIEEERLLQIQLENQRKQDELKRQETSRLLENEKIIIPAVLPSIVTTSILLPLVIIGLFLYSRTGRK
jgi:hypothetical protein|tara:strand:- start:399 stop:839 length:441 start_codon:yes stop_codon:yes gene_type:complete